MTGLLISTKEIAELARTRLSTVSNWKNRSRTFPQPAGKRNGVNVFDYDEVVAWLKANGKTADTEGRRQLLWIITDILRQAVPEDDLTASMAVLFGLRRAAAEYGLEGQWEDLAQNPSEDALDGYVDRLEELDGAAPVPRLANLIPEARRRAPRMAKALGKTLPVIERMSGKDLSDLLDAAIERNSRERDSRSPLINFSSLGLDDTLAAFALETARGTGHADVYDPACGLEQTGMEFARRHPDSSLFLSDANPTAAMLAEVRFLLACGTGLDVRVRTVNSLEEDGQPGVKADLVLLQPPFGLRPKDVGETPANDPRWTYTQATGTSPSLMFLQDAIHHLKPDGVILMACLERESFAANRNEGKIRRKLVAEGRVKAMVALRNDRRRTPTSAAFDLWIVGGPDPDLASVHMVDGRKPADGRVDMGELPGWLSRPLKGIWKDGSYRWSSVSIRDVLADESATLTPSRWVRSADENPRIIAGEMASKASAIHGLVDSAGSERSILRSIPSEAPEFKEAATISIRELVAQGRAELHRGTDLLKRVHGQPNDIVTRDELQRGIPDAAPCVRQEDGVRRTRAGDILFTCTAPVDAAVDENGGHRVGYGLCALTLTGSEWDPRFAAACLRARWNLRNGTGPVPRISLSDMELPLVDRDVQDRYLSILSVRDEVRRLDENVSAYLETLCNAIRFGTES